MRLGAQATEAAIKALSRSKELGRYKVIHLNTHGALAGELNGTAEPGLVLTPPTKETDEDEGYLSACNTAAGDAKTAEALSGLARAFFYAGTRSLLVSHWAVYAQSTAHLVSAAVGGPTKADRAKALQKAMLEMIDKPPRSVWAHPTYWAPFILVGEGADEIESNAHVRTRQVEPKEQITFNTCISSLGQIQPPQPPFFC